MEQGGDDSAKTPAQGAPADERRLRALIQYGADIVTLHQEDGTILYTAASVTHILGYLDEEWAGQLLGAWVHPEDQHHLTNLFADMRAAPGAPRAASFRVRHRRGAWRWMEATGTNLLGDPSVRALVLNQHDVTEKRVTEEALRQSEQRFRALVENSEDSIQLATARGTILYGSPSTERIFGRPADEVVGRNVFELIHAEDRGGLAEWWQRCLDLPGVPLRGEFRLPSPEGSERYVEMMLVNHLADPGLRAVVTIYRDVSERKVLEARMRLSQKMEAIGRLAGGIAHDFNNILSAIHGFASIVDGELPKGDPLRQDMHEILRAVDRAALLTRQLLAFGRRQVLQPQVMDLSASLRDMDRMLQRVIGEDIELVLRLSEEPVLTKADPSQFEQVLLNLVVNARDAMPKGGRLIIDTSLVELDEKFADAHPEVVPGKYVAISVVDTGMGMSKTVQEHIFEPFFTTKDNAQGTGLGLATVFGIVKQSGGHIVVESKPTQGSTFRVYFPRSGDELRATNPSLSALPLAASGGSETILLVEDEAAVRIFVARVLRRSGYQILDASNGGEALLIAEQHTGPIHLLLTDVVMPRLSGRQLAERLKGIRRHMRVLYMSGYAEAAIAQHGVLDPGTAFIEKPLTAEGLGRKVREVLDQPWEPI